MGLRDTVKDWLTEGKVIKAKSPLCSKRLVKENENQQEEKMPEDERIAKILLEIANSIMECIKMEADMPSRNTDSI